MGNVTLSIPEELHKKMREHTEFKLELAEKLLSNSLLTEEDAERIGHVVSENRKKVQ